MGERTIIKSECGCGAKIEFDFESYFYTESFNHQMKIWNDTHKDCPSNVVKKVPYHIGRKRGQQ